MTAFWKWTSPKDNYTFKPLLDASIFGEPAPKRPPSKPLPKDVKLNTQPTAAQLGKLRKISAQQNSAAPSKEILNLAVGMQVSHTRFGKGTVKTIDGQGNDKKALIAFTKPHGEKNLLLRFAKLQILP